jgi:hypothetical protein
LKWLCREKPANNNLNNGTAKQLKEKEVKALIYSRLHDFRNSIDVSHLHTFVLLVRADVHIEGQAAFVE